MNKLAQLREMLGFSMRQMAALFKLDEKNGADNIRKIIAGKSQISGPLSMLVDQMLPLAEAINEAKKTKKGAKNDE